MVKQKTLIIVLVAASVGLAAVLAGLWYVDQLNRPTHSAEVTVKVYGPNWTIVAEHVAVENASALDALKTAGSDNIFPVLTEHYAGMGELVISINGTTGNFTHFWLYGVNGVAGDVGSDQKWVYDGDVVTFWFTDDFASTPPEG